MNITDDTLLKFAREGAARYMEMRGEKAIARHNRSGKADADSDVQSGLHTARYMLEQGWRPASSLEDIKRVFDQTLRWITSGLKSRDYERFHAALYPPLTPSRVQIARERLRISDEVTDAEIADFLKETNDGNR